MKTYCTYCSQQNSNSSDLQVPLQKHGFFYRSSDRKKVLRFFCRFCKKTFSSATTSKCRWQKKRQYNHKIARLLVSVMTQRECARVLKLNRKTIVRKFMFMGEQAKEKLIKINQAQNLSKAIQFDDLETFEHTKCKPLSITLAVDEATRRILGYEVSRMPAKGLLAAMSLKKYGKREDLRAQGREKLFQTLKKLTLDSVQIKSDENPHYQTSVDKHYPKSKYLKYKGRRGAVVGQGELKKIGFDPLFSLNHTCATLRARVSRLVRRTWCTTKKPERLDLHLALTALHHNLSLPMIV